MTSWRDTVLLLSDLGHIKDSLEVMAQVHRENERHEEAEALERTLRKVNALLSEVSR